VVYEEVPAISVLSAEAPRSVKIKPTDHSNTLIPFYHTVHQRRQRLLLLLPWKHQIWRGLVLLLKHSDSPNLILGFFFVKLSAWKQKRYHIANIFHLLLSRLKIDRCMHYALYGYVTCLHMHCIFIGLLAITRQTRRKETETMEGLYLVLRGFAYSH
jgi:hypothetical protein